MGDFFSVTKAEKITYYEFQRTVVFMSLDQSKGEAFGQLIIGVYPRLSSECFAPTLFCKSSNRGYPDMANATLSDK